MDSEHRTNRLVPALMVALFLAGIWSLLIYTLQVDLSVGGNSWRQGDWLIHGLVEPVRRGPFGSALLTLADLLHMHPLVLLITLQGLIVTVIFLAVGAAVIRLGNTDKLLLLLCSPGFFVLFWFNDLQGAMRKEILVYLAFVPLILAAGWRQGSSWLIGFAILIYGGAVFAHEGNVFFLPFVCGALWLVMPSQLGLVGRIVVLSLPALLALAAGLYAVTYPMVADTAQICSRLVQQGLDTAICDGAIAYMSTTPEGGRMHPSRLLSTHFHSFLLIYASCLLPFRLFFLSSEGPQSSFLVALLAGFAFLPLYLLAGDYGRWLNFHITALVFVLLVYCLVARPPWLLSPLPRLDLLCLMALNLMVGVSHSPGEFIDGFLVNLTRGVAAVLRG